MVSFARLCFALPLLMLVLLGASGAALAQDPAAAPEASLSVVSEPLSPTPVAQLAVRTVDELGPSYVLESITWSVPGGEVGHADSFETKQKLRREPRPGPVVQAPPQAEVMEVTAVVRGRGAGQFAYLERYRVQISGSCPVDLAPEFTTEVEVVVVRDAGALAEFEAGLGLECRAMTMR